MAVEYIKSEVGIELKKHSIGTWSLFIFSFSFLFLGGLARLLANFNGFDWFDLMVAKFNIRFMWGRWTVAFQVLD